MYDASSRQLLRSPQDILSKVPYLLGYHPSDSVVTLYIGHHGRLLAYTNVSLPAPASDIAEQTVDMATRCAAYLVVLVGYGPRAHAGAVVAAADLANRHVNVAARWLVSDGHYYCLRDGCTCGAAMGVPFDPRATAVAAESTVRGETALPSRDALLALVDPDPAAHAAVTQAILRTAPAPPTGADLDELLEQAKLDQRLTDAGAARMAILLQNLTLRDTAWKATGHQMWQRNLWLDLTRRIPGSYVAAPAALAAWCAWMRGENTLALAAAHRSSQAVPAYTMTRLVVTTILSKTRPCDTVPDWPAVGLPDHNRRP